MLIKITKFKFRSKYAFLYFETEGVHIKCSQSDYLQPTQTGPNVYASTLIDSHQSLSRIMSLLQEYNSATRKHTSSSYRITIFQQENRPRLGILRTPAWSFRPYRAYKAHAAQVAVGTTHRTLGIKNEKGYMNYLSFISAKTYNMDVSIYICFQRGY